MTQVLQKNENLEKIMKELVAKTQKVNYYFNEFVKICKMQDADNLDVLLTVDGVKKLKSMCYKNLDMKAKDTEEIDMLNRFMIKSYLNKKN
jgi:hypothetical protein